MINVPKVKANVSRWAIMSSTTGAVAILLEQDLIILEENVSHHVFDFLFVDLLSFDVLDIYSIKIFNGVSSLFKSNEEVEQLLLYL